MLFGILKITYLNIIINKQKKNTNMFGKKKQGCKKEYLVFRPYFINLLKVVGLKWCIKRIVMKEEKKKLFTNDTL